ncbi:hypothetical protein BG003_000892 [Podila horticola]|nr:hypothetical protein BG003_000892 [Podila horticola]
MSKSHEIGRCVQSLGRVPQLWTSYSGYFREVKVMCLAVQYSLENDQITLLRAQRQELLETHRVETAQLKEIQDLHSNISAQVDAILTSASQVRDTFASILKDISTITQHANKGVVEQGQALSNMQQVNEEFLSSLQEALLQTVELVARQSLSWNDMMNNGLLRFQELNKHAEEQLVKVVRANQGLESVVQQVDVITSQLHHLKEQAIQGTQELLKQQYQGSEEITQSTMKILQNMIFTLDTLDNRTQASWQGMIESFKTESSDFQKEVTDLLTLTASDIGSMASEAQEKIDQLNDVFYELKAKRWRFTWPIQMAFQFLDAEGIFEPTALVSTAMATVILIAHSFLYGILATGNRSCRDNALRVHCTEPNVDPGVVPPPGGRKIDAAYVHKGTVLEVDAASHLSREKQEPKAIHL